MKFKKLLQMLTEEVIKDKTVSSGGDTVTISLESIRGEKYRVSAKGALSGHSDYDSKDSAENRYKSLDSFSAVEKWLGKSKGKRGRVRGIIGLNRPHKPKPDPDPEPEPDPDPDPDTGNGGTNGTNGGSTESKKRK